MSFVRLRTFVPQPGTPWHDRWRDGHLTLLSAHQALHETRLLIEHLDYLGQMVKAMAGPG